MLPPVSEIILSSLIQSRPVICFTFNVGPTNYYINATVCDQQRADLYAIKGIRLACNEKYIKIWPRRMH